MWDDMYGAPLNYTSPYWLNFVLGSRWDKSLPSLLPLSFAAQPIHGQPQAGLHAADGLGQQADFIL